MNQTPTGDPAFDTLSDTLAAQDRVHPGGCLFLECRQDVGIGVQREGDLRVPKRLHDYPRIDTLSQKQRRARVPQVV
jgi:hypothetical protein